jgi:hypothetical protein
VAPVTDARAPAAFLNPFSNFLGALSGSNGGAAGKPSGKL